MKIMLVSGAPSTGKTTAVKHLAEYLQNNGFACKIGKIQTGRKDCLVSLEGKGKNGNAIKIAVNSASDTFEIIDRLSEFIAINGPFDILISSARDIDEERDYLFKILKIKDDSKDVIELPLAKITRRNEYDKAIKWYTKIISSITLHIIKNRPFEIV